MCTGRVYGMTIDPAALYRHKPMIVLAYGRREEAGIREVHRDKYGNPTGINVQGSDFRLDGSCPLTPWLRLEEAPVPAGWCCERPA